MTKTLTASLLLAMWVPAAVVAQDDQAPLERQLFLAMQEELSMGSRPIAHCRNAGPPMDSEDVWARCNRRLRAFARYFVEAGQEHNVDPWTLAAIARKESAYSPFVRGGAGEGSIMQLHPRNQDTRDSVTFIRRMNRRWYVHNCRRQVGACQEEAVHRAAEILSLSIARCDDARAGLNAYNLGTRCDRSWRYAIRVYRIRNRLMGAAGDS